MDKWRRNDDSDRTTWKDNMEKWRDFGGNARDERDPDRERERDRERDRDRERERDRDRDRERDRERDRDRERAVDGRPVSTVIKFIIYF